MSKFKYYVVWEGRARGIFNSWEECKEQVENFKGAKYKSFDSLEEATEAFRNAPDDYFDVLHKIGEFMRTTTSGPTLPPEVIADSLAEFLALVHGLAYLQQRGSDMPIYSDSRNAIAWVRQKKCKTKLTPNAANAPIFNLIVRAERWLQTHTYTNPIIKWETEQWGEIPADFGRK